MQSVLILVIFCISIPFVLSLHLVKDDLMFKKKDSETVLKQDSSVTAIEQESLQSRNGRKRRLNYKNPTGHYSIAEFRDPLRNKNPKPLGSSSPTKSELGNYQKTTTEFIVDNYGEAETTTKSCECICPNSNGAAYGEVSSKVEEAFANPKPTESGLSLSSINLGALRHVDFENALAFVGAHINPAGNFVREFTKNIGVSGIVNGTAEGLSTALKVIPNLTQTISGIVDFFEDTE